MLRICVCLYIYIYIYIYVREMFGPQNVNWWNQDQQKIAIKADHHIAILDPTFLVSMCDALPKRARGEGPEMTPTGVCVCVCVRKTLLSH